jgi:hypothetical protein
MSDSSAIDNEAKLMPPPSALPFKKPSALPTKKTPKKTNSCREKKMKRFLFVLKVMD